MGSRTRTGIGNYGEIHEGVNDNEENNVIIFWVVHWNNRCWWQHQQLCSGDPKQVAMWLKLYHRPPRQQPFFFSLPTIASQQPSFCNTTPDAPGGFCWLTTRVSFSNGLPLYMQLGLLVLKEQSRAIKCTDLNLYL